MTSPATPSPDVSVDRLGRLYGWTPEERDHVAALVAEARGTFAAADSEQDRLAEWVLANCPGEPSQDGGVVDTVIRLITSARADENARRLIAEGRAAQAEAEVALLRQSHGDSDRTFADMARQLEKLGSEVAQARAERDELGRDWQPPPQRGGRRTGTAAADLPPGADVPGLPVWTSLR